MYRDDETYFFYSAYLQIEEIVLSSDSEDDSDSDDSVIYIGTYPNTQRRSDQQDTTEEISEAMHTDDFDELLRNYFRSI